MMASRYRVLGLKFDPFSPMEAERREKSALVLVGPHVEVCRTIMNEIQESIGRNISKGCIITGGWGSGKSAILRKLYFDLEDNNSALCTYIRLPVGTTLQKFLMEIIKHCSRHLQEGEILQEVQELSDQPDEELPNSSELYNLMIEVIARSLRSNNEVKCYVLMLDQSENLIETEENLELVARYLRDILIDVKNASGKSIFVVLSLLSRAYGKLQNFREMLRDYLVTPLRQISLEDCKRLFKELLGIARLEEATKYITINPYYPFTDDGIEKIYYRSGGSPGLIYNLASKCLSEAVTIGVDKIDGEFVKTVIMPIEPSWIEALSKPPIPIRECLGKILECAQELEIIGSSLDLSNSSLENAEYLRTILGIEEEELKMLDEDIRRSKSLIDFLVVNKKEGRDYMVLIKVSEKLLRSDTAKKIESLLKVAKPTIEGRELLPENVKVIGLSGGAISQQAKNHLKSLRISKGYRVLTRRIDLNRPELYGRIRALVERLEEIYDTYGDYSFIPSDIRDDLKNEIMSILSDLGIIDDYA